jgi:predicted aminopeptidase
VIGQGFHAELLDTNFFVAAQMAYDETIAFGIEQWGIEKVEKEEVKGKGKGKQVVRKQYEEYHAEYVENLEKHLKAWF